MGDFIIKDRVLEKYIGNGGHVVVPDGVTEIGERAFAESPSFAEIFGDVPPQRTYITSVQIPNSVTTIGNEAFFSCWKLTSLQIPESVTKLGKRLFPYCPGLTSLQMCANTQIENDTFHFNGWTDLKEFILTAPKSGLIDMRNVMKIMDSVPETVKVFLKTEPSRPKIRRTVRTFAPLTESEIKNL